MSSGAVLGVVRSQRNAEANVVELLSTHFEPRDLSVLFPDPDLLQHPGDIGPLLPGLARAQPAGMGGGVPQTLLELGVGVADAARCLNTLRTDNPLIAVRGNGVVDTRLAENILIRFGAEDVWVSTQFLPCGPSEATATEPISAKNALSHFLTFETPGSPPWK